MDKVSFREYATYYRYLKNDEYPLIVLHGGPGSTHNYFEVLDPLYDKGHSILMYDQLGCGESYVDHHPELWKPETWVEELDNLIKSLKIKKFHLLGQSWGGMLALLYALDKGQDNILSLILSSTLPSSALWAKEQHRLISFMSEEDIKAIKEAEENNNFSSPAYQLANEHFMKLPCADIKDSDPICVRREKKVGHESYLYAWGENEFHPSGTLKDFDVIDRLKDIKVPTLIISGTNDLCTPLIAKTMFDGIKDSRWELFDGCRHMCYVEDTKHYLNLIDEWLKEHNHE